MPISQDQKNNSFVFLFTNQIYLSAALYGTALLRVSCRFCACTLAWLLNLKYDWAKEPSSGKSMRNQFSPTQIRPISLVAEFTLPSCLRPSHHRSYTACVLNVSKRNRAYPARQNVSKVIMSSKLTLTGFELS